MCSVNLNMIHSKYIQSEDGSIGMTAGLSLPVLLLLVFGALDYSQVTSAKQELESAAAAAALAAVNEAHIAYSAREDVDLEKLIQETASQVLSSRTGHINSIDLGDVKVSPTVSGNLMTVDISYSAKVDSMLSSVVGVDSFPVSGQQRAKASAKRARQVDL